MDFKSKFKTLVAKGHNNNAKSNSSQADDGASAKSQGGEMSVKNLKDHIPAVSSYVREKECRFTQNDVFIGKPELEDEILLSIDNDYFSPKVDQNQFDPDEFVLARLPENLDLGYIIGEKTRLKKQLFVVSKKVSDLILKHQPAYVVELQRVTDLQNTLSETIKICTRSRHQFDQAKQNFTYASLNIVASYRRKEVLKNLLKSLLTIKTLQQTDVRLRELLHDGDFSGAVRLCLECQNAANGLSHFRCVSELSTKLQDTLEMTEEHIDVALSKICTSFNEKVYGKLQDTYHLLGKTQSSIDQLFMHFASVIHNETFSVVLGYVQLCSTDGVHKSDHYQKKQFNELCQCLTDDCYIPCYVDLCKVLWNVLQNYRRVLHWHQDNSNQNATETDGNSDTGDLPPSDIDSIHFNERFVKQRLDQGRSRVWQDMQQKLRVYLSHRDLSSYSFDEFISVLRVSRRVIEIGYDFCGCPSEDLETKLNDQTTNYFKTYHKKCMDDLKVFLEHEMWKLCPIKANFSVTHLQEFQFLKSRDKYNKLRSPLSSPSKSSRAYLVSDVDSPGSRRTSDTPFDSILFEFKDDEDILGLDGEDGFHGESTEDETGESRTTSVVDFHDGPLVTLTTLNVLRQLGKYLQMMNVLNTIAFDVLLCMFHVFDYYIYTVFLFFGKEMSDMSDSILTNRIRQTIRRIEESVIDDSTNSENSSAMRFNSPTLSELIDLSREDNLFGVGERVVGVESLTFLANHFASLRSHFEELIPESKRPILDQYFTQTIDAAGDVRLPVYMLVAAKSVNYDRVLSMTMAVKWDVKEIMSQHNLYVDQLLQEMENFKEKLSLVCSKELGAHLPIEASNVLWQQVLKLSSRTFVEGFAQAKKCTNEGRALMQLDFQQFLSKIEKIVSVRPIPEKELVEEYIRAYYMTEATLEPWIRARKGEYTPKQLISLVNCMMSDNKKSRGRLVSVIDAELGLSGN